MLCYTKTSNGTISVIAKTSANLGQFSLIFVSYGITGLPTFAVTINLLCYNFAEYQDTYVEGEIPDKPVFLEVSGLVFNVSILFSLVLSGYLHKKAPDPTGNPKKTSITRIASAGRRVIFCSDLLV